MSALPQTPPPTLLTEVELEILGDCMHKPFDEPISPTTLSRWRVEKHSVPVVQQALERLVRLGLLEQARASVEQTGGTAYHLPTTAEGWALFARFYLKSLSKTHEDGWLYAAHSFLSSEFSRRYLNQAYLRSCLASRGVAIRYSVDSKTGNPSERDYSLRLGGWKLPARGRDVHLTFPVGLDSGSPGTLSRVGREEYASSGIEPTVFAEVVRRHYVELEGRMLVLPILSLVRISPSALLALLEEWAPADPETVVERTGISTIDHVVFRLVFAAISDLAESRDLPDRGDEILAAVRPEQSRGQRHDPPLLEVCFVGGDVLGFEAGFDTSHEFYQGEDDGPEDIHEIERNPENCWVGIWWDHSGPGWNEEGLETRIGYKFEDPALLQQLLQESEVPGTKNKRPPILKQAAWLGDAILDAYVTVELLRRLTASTANQLNQLHQRVTSNATLASVARQLGLKVSPRWNRPTTPPPWFAEEGVGMLADSVEALIGAAYMDGGMKAAETVARRLMRNPLEDVAPTTHQWAHHGRNRREGGESDGAGTPGVPRNDPEVAGPGSSG